MVWPVLNPDIHAAVIEFTKTKSHRVMAVVGGAIIEEALLRALDHRMRPPSKTGHPSFAMKKLFEPNRPLGGFGPKIDLGYALHIYDVDTLQALGGFASIRNVFAHRLAITSFAANDTKLRTAFAQLKLHTKHTYYPDPFTSDPSQHRIPKAKTNQAVFVTTMKIVLALIM